VWTNELSQFHFHMPSEHRVAGRGYDMEAHFVHTSAAGGFAVVAVLLERGPSSGPFALISDNLPDTLNAHEPLPQSFSLAHDEEIVGLYDCAVPRATGSRTTGLEPDAVMPLRHDRRTPPSRPPIECGGRPAGRHR